jgi:DNA-3-methyladenine glycosylase II
VPNDKFQIGINHLIRHDKQLSTIIKIIGNRNLTPHRQYFNLLLRTIIGQQLSTIAATSIQKRLFSCYKGKPTPQLILQTEDSVLRGLGLSNAKVKYVKDLSAKVLNGELKLKNFAQKSDEQIISELTKVKGIGVWSSHMFLIFTLARLNVLATGDLGIRKAIMLNYRLRKLPSEEKIKQIAFKNNWHPFCTVACVYLWESLDNNFVKN